MERKRITIVDNEDYLRQISKDVDFNDLELDEEIQDLIEYTKSHVVFAMAAVQIGIPKRIIYLKNTTDDYTKNEDLNYDEAKLLINPVVLNKKGLTKFLECCASCIASKEEIDKGNDAKYLACVVERPYEIELEYYDIKGAKHREIFKGFESTVLAHELDHLDGVLHIDLNDEVMAMNLEERNAFRKAHPYEVISEV